MRGCLCIRAKRLNGWQINHSANYLILISRINSLH